MAILSEKVQEETEKNTAKTMILQEKTQEATEKK